MQDQISYVVIVKITDVPLHEFLYGYHGDLPVHHGAAHVVDAVSRVGSRHAAQTRDVHAGNGYGTLARKHSGTTPPE